jgi:hypothetical protein
MKYVLSRTPIWPVLAFAMALVLAGCSSSFKSDVARFHQLPRPSGETFVIEAKDPQKQGSLEFAQYASGIAARLSALGYRQAERGAMPDLVVKLDYYVDDGQVETRSYGSGFYGGYYHRYDPWFWGYPGYYDRDIRSYVMYNRRLEMDIERASGSDKGQRLFEGRVESRGRDNRLPEVMPYLIEALFKDFPGQSGITQRIIIKEDEGGY